MSCDWGFHFSELLWKVEFLWDFLKFHGTLNYIGKKWWKIYRNFRQFLKSKKFFDFGIMGKFFIDFQLWCFGYGVSIPPYDVANFWEPIEVLIHFWNYYKKLNFYGISWNSMGFWIIWKKNVLYFGQCQKPKMFFYFGIMGKFFFHFQSYGVLRVVFLFLATTSRIAKNSFRFSFIRITIKSSISMGLFEILWGSQLYGIFGQFRDPEMFFDSGIMEKNFIDFQSYGVLVMVFFY